MQNHNKRTVYIVSALEDDEGVKRHIPLQVFRDPRLADDMKAKLEAEGRLEVIVDDTCVLDESTKR